jgi:hypothetical protein
MLGEGEMGGAIILPKMPSLFCLKGFQDGIVPAMFKTN